MIYITGDTHNTEDMSNLSSKNMKLCCMEENLKQLHRDSNVVLNDKIDSSISYKKWFFGHWHSDWGKDV